MQILIYCFIYSHCYVPTVVWKEKDPEELLCDCTLFAGFRKILTGVTHIQVISIDRV